MTARRPVLLAGVGTTRTVAEDPRSIPEMVLEAVEAALADARLGFEDIDAVVTASVDLLDGLTASNVAVTEVVGAVMKPETRVAADGLLAAAHAACQLWAGAYDTVLVVAHGKASMAPGFGLTAWALDPIVLQPLGVDFLVCAGLEARALATKDPEAERRWARTAALRRADAGLASMRTEDVLASPVLASPLRGGMCAPPADAACAVVLCAAEREAPRPSVWMTGVGWDLEPHALGNRRLGAREGLSRACARAYAVAGIEDPAAAFDLAEPSCLFSHEEELFLRASGLGPRTLVSPGGGLFGGAAPVAAGLGRLAAAAGWLRAAGEARRALVHGTWGPAGQGQVVATLEAA